jgi:hypothetical protein
MTERSMKFSSSPNVTGPTPIDQRAHSLGGNLVDLAAHFRGEFFFVKCRTRTGLSSGRSRNGGVVIGKDFQAIIKITAEEFVAHHLGEVAIGSGD